MSPPTTPTALVTDQLDLGDLGRLVPLGRPRRDWLRTILIVDALFLFWVSCLWALWTHREWLRAIDAAIAVLSLCELVRLLLSRRD